MLKYLYNCFGIITDSGGIIKTAPFFGKNCIIPFGNTEWEKVVYHKFAHLGMDKKYFDQTLISFKNFYYHKNCLEYIWEKTKRYYNLKNRIKYNE